MRIPVLERERFIADTLYKKLWIHDFLPCPYRTWLFVFYPNSLYRKRKIQLKLSYKVWGHIFIGGFFMSGRSHEEGLKDLTLLGNQGTTYSFEYAPEVLEAVDNLHPERDYFVKFNCPEFTSL